MVALEVQGLAHMGGAQSGEEQGPQLPGPGTRQSSPGPDMADDTAAPQPRRLPRLRRHWLTESQESSAANAASPARRAGGAAAR
ncbi:hypothetical protein SSCG_01954 [Streptomyces clavuligerus]|nr:hypothetical protein SSCG_01954 [Streptomyces clavuligerus]